MNSTGDTETFPRPLTPREAETLAFMLSANDATLDPFREQVKAVTVTGRCTCGCPTIYLAIDRRLAAPADSGNIASTSTRAGFKPIYTLTLMAEDVWLSQLRLSWFDEPPPRDFPPSEVFDQPSI